MPSPVLMTTPNEITSLSFHAVFVQAVAKSRT